MCKMHLVKNTWFVFSTENKKKTRQWLLFEIGRKETENTSLSLLQIKG